MIPTFEETFFELVDGIPGEKFLERFPKVLLRRVCGAALSPALRASLLASNYRLYIVRNILSFYISFWDSSCPLVAEGKEKALLNPALTSRLPFLAPRGKICLFPHFYQHSSNGVPFYPVGRPLLHLHWPGPANSSLL